MPARGKGCRTKFLVLLSRSRLKAELSALLQATELIEQERIDRVAALVANHVQEGIGCYTSVARVWKRRTDKPGRTAISATRIFLAFRSAVVGLKLVVKFVSRQDNGEPIRTKAVGITDGLEYGTADWVGGVWRLQEPEIGEDPHAQQIVAEIAERAIVDAAAHGRIGADAVAIAAIHGIAIGGEPPILPEIRSGNIGDRVAVDEGIVHRKAWIRNWMSLVGIHTDRAGASGELTIRQKLVLRGVSLEIAYEVLRADPAGVETCGVSTGAFRMIYCTNRRVVGERRAIQ